MDISSIFPRNHLDAKHWLLKTFTDSFFVSLVFIEHLKDTLDTKLLLQSVVHLYPDKLKNFYL